MWFQNLTGFQEEHPEQVRINLELEGEYVYSKVNGKKYKHGRLEIPMLSELIQTCPNPNDYSNNISINEAIGNVQDFHVGYENAMFQAASQFNLLEMVNPDVTPEMGVSIYELDFTQGPACAIACGAGTIYRNYFVPIENQIGQTKTKQVDCLDEIGKALNNSELQLWKMRNGYAFLENEGLKTISDCLTKLSDEAYQKLKGKLKIGLQWNTEVTVKHGGHLVSQAYCSALPIGYGNIPVEKWKEFATLILDAAYEATFYAALRNYEITGNENLFLTLVGGGVFGNPQQWIFNAIAKSILKFRSTPLKVKVVSYGKSNLELRSFLEELD